METPKGARTRDWHDAGPAPSMATHQLSVSASQTLELLRMESTPVGLATISLLADLHPNTVCEHLDTLTGAGLVTRTRARAERRRRPAWLYAARAILPADTECAGLAIALAEVIQHTSPDPGKAAELAGETWGRDLARQRGAGHTTPEAARQHAVELLDDLGFAPLLDEYGADPTGSHLVPFAEPGSCLRLVPPPPAQQS